MQPFCLYTAISIKHASEILAKPSLFGMALAKNISRNSRIDKDNDIEILLSSLITLVLPKIKCF